MHALDPATTLLVVLLFVRPFGSCTLSAVNAGWQELALFLLKEIKTPQDYKEKSFAELLRSLESLQHGGAKLAENLKEEVDAIDSPDSLFDILHSRLKHLCQPADGLDNNTAFVGRLEPSSVFGLFVRRVVPAPLESESMHCVAPGQRSIPRAPLIPRGCCLRQVLNAELDMFGALGRLYDAMLQYREAPEDAPRGRLFPSQLEAWRPP